MTRFTKDRLAGEQESVFVEQLFESAPVGMCVTDETAVVLDVNPMLCRMLGLERSMVLGRPFSAFMPRDNRALALTAYRTVLAGGFLDQPDWNVRLRDGSQMWVRVSPARARLDDGRVVVLSVLADVTASRRAEAERAQELNRELEMRVAERTAQLSAAFEELESFSYSVSHDLRAPLRTIDGFSKALLEDKSDVIGPEGMDHLERVRAAAQRMGRLIDDLLEFARLARADIHRQKVDISSTSREIAEEVARWWPDTHVDLVVQPDIWAVADPGLLRMVLVNLLDNAWKFSSEAAGPRVEVGIERGWCYIKDNGAGFDAQFAHKLFLPFERLHSAKQFPGTGIGLASVKRIVNRHGGEVRAEGQIGKGATIYFKFDAGR